MGAATDMLVRARGTAAQDAAHQAGADGLQPLVLPQRWVPWWPNPKQEAFLRLTDREAFYGGAAGPGKSTALLMAALQYVDVPGYSAALFRRTFPELAMPGGLIPRSKEWLMGTPARWNQNDHTWTFPSGAVLLFGHMQYKDDMFNYQSSEFDFIGFDELTTFYELQYRYLFSRLRRRADSTVPSRMRGASNPGGLGHEWVKKRLVDPQTRVASFLRAVLEDNPKLDQAGYLESLAQLPAVERQRLRHGDWEAEDEGTMFKRHWWQLTDRHPESVLRVRYWDLAATEENESDSATDPDYTAGSLWTWHPVSQFHVADVVHGRWTPGDVQRKVLATARADGYDTHIWIEQEPGASGKSIIDAYKRALPGYVVRGRRFGGNSKVKQDKVTRAVPVSVAAENGLVSVYGSWWTEAWLDEHAGFPGSMHDDMVDTSSGAYWALTQGNAPSGVASAAGVRLVR